MSPAQPSTPSLKAVENIRKVCALSSKELSARDYSALFHEGVCARFVATQSLKQTARDYAIPARVVSEILHLANFRRPMTIARNSSSTMFGSRNVRTA